MVRASKNGTNPFDVTHILTKSHGTCCQCMCALLGVHVPDCYLRRHRWVQYLSCKDPMVSQKINIKDDNSENNADDKWHLKRNVKGVHVYVCVCDLFFCCWLKQQGSEDQPGIVQYKCERWLCKGLNSACPEL